MEIVTGPDNSQNIEEELNRLVAEYQKTLLHMCSFWLKERLRLDVSPEKTKVVNLRKGYSNFLDIKIARGFRSCKKE